MTKLILAGGLSALVLASCATAQDDAAATEAAALGPCQPTVYEALSISIEADGSEIPSHARQTRYCIADGAVEMLEFRALGSNLDTVFHGVTFAIWDDARTRADVLWVMVGTAGHTDIDQTYADGRITAEGEGADPPGPFVERSTTEFMPGGDEHFIMERSYDEGATWRRFNEIFYLDSEQEPPWLPEEWSEQIAAFAPDLAEFSGFVILDGFAGAEVLRDEAGAPTGVRFETVVQTDEGWVWRALTWSAADGVTETIDTPAG